MAAINIANELKCPGKVAQLKAEYEISDLFVMGRELVPVTPICVDISYSYDGEGGLNVKGTLFARFSEQCARCGKQFVMPFSCEFSERFIKAALNGQTITDTYPDAFTFAGDILDLSDFLREQILLQYPTVCLCDSDCKGLCPACGQNLNDGMCRCNEESDIKEHLSEDEALKKGLEALMERYSKK